MLDTLYVTGFVDASGTGRVAVTPPARQNWSVRQVSGSATGAGSASVCNMYLSGQFITGLPPLRFSAVEPPPLPVRNGQTMEIVWTEATPGAQLDVTVIYDDGN